MKYQGDTSGEGLSVALMKTLVEACDGHLLHVLKGIEEAYERWEELKARCSEAADRLAEINSSFFDHLLAKASAFPSSVFTNVFNLSIGLLPQIQHTVPLAQPVMVLSTQAPTLGVFPSMHQLPVRADDNGGDGDGDGGDDPNPDSQKGEDQNGDDDLNGDGSDHDRIDQENDAPEEEDIIEIRDDSCSLPRSTKWSGSPLPRGGKSAHQDGNSGFQLICSANGSKATMVLM